MSGKDLCAPPLLSLILGDTFIVRVTPKASQNRVAAEELGDGSVRVRVYVTTVPEDGKANKAVMALLAKALGVPKCRLELICGHTSRDKTFRILP